MAAIDGADRRPSSRRRWLREGQAVADNLAAQWRAAAEGAGLGRAGSNGAGVGFIATPRMVAADLRGAPVLTIELMPSQLAADLAAVADRLAEGMGVAAARVTAQQPGYARVALLLADPLAHTLPLTPGLGLLIGRGEDGNDLRCEPVDLPHLLVQGQTRSGKSSWLYALLAQLAHRAEVEVAGVDPSGITLRPFAATHHRGRIALGLGDLAATEAVLAGLVADMDARLAAMPADRDVLPVGPAWPLRVVVLEEWPAVLRALDTDSTATGKRVRALVARLLAESHKVGYRVVLAAQRAEATIVGGAERAQCAGRLTFRVDGLDSIKLLHTDADTYAAGHIAAPPGIALCTWPGIPLARIRGPWIGSYGDYAAAITAGRPAA
ncbi:FtsK/SpoIIIE domain-containing protein [Pseudonocardia sp. N23]|uniref:FtsK/SpoIIIE domain-containing protein n=1 Tax=Pseudonocardia sp. N23 TaxID=1987376 RepID=UPI000BFD8132|nr:FtsK/SpoIIIE domain-containing protein [Pseudonocardia sp. N23]GAY09832.1 cell division protein FtsK [Pseudonocardia sp. N23]